MKFTNRFAAATANSACNCGVCSPQQCQCGCAAPAVQAACSCGPHCGCGAACGCNQAVAFREYGPI